MAASEDISYRVIPVREVDWSNLNIKRAAIIPIHRDSKYRWIGVGINKFGSLLSTIGGAYEKEDHDLLSTAVREWNEELGSNVIKLKEEDLYNRYSIVTNEFIYILYPISKIQTFKPTPEISGLIWLTPNQLFSLISEENNLYFPNQPENKIINFTKEFRFTAPIIATVVQNNDIFSLFRTSELFVRPKRISREYIERLASFEDFMNEINHAWYAVTLFVGPKEISIRNRTYTTYIIPIELEKEVITTINQYNVKILIALYSDISFYLDIGIPRTNLIVIEDRINHSDLSSSFLKSFQGAITNARKENFEDRVIIESDLIFKSEYTAYINTHRFDIISKNRLCFFRILNAINFMISTSKFLVSFDTIISFLSKQVSVFSDCPKFMFHKTGKGLNSTWILQALININVLTLDSLRSSINIP